ncbi:unnamed protein product [Toxocara canis]|uniref:DUF148 domain-containing protein n=1 Tax=Toxocara canis TaxID=6265 RepID=A0A183UIW9_TOXCA|nr:unnamed protein product [Toxocara canis]
MRWITALLLSSTLITLALCRPEKKKSILDGLGKLLKDVLVTTTTTTTVPPGFVDQLLNRGKNIAKQQYSTHKQKVLDTIGNYAEQAGVNRGIAQAVSSQFIDDSIKKGKTYFAQRRNSTVTAEPMHSQDGASATHRRTESAGRQQHQHATSQQDEMMEEPMVQKKVEFKKGGYGGY